MKLYDDLVWRGLIKDVAGDRGIAVAKKMLGL